MASVPMQLDPLRKGLLKVGFREDRLRTDFLIPGSQSRVPLLAFADQPFDSRTASVAVLDKPDADESDFRSEDRLRTDFLIPGSQSRVPLLAFADQPFDSRTASVAVLDKPDADESDF